MDASANETHTLIGSDKVEGTAVFGPDGERMGSIARVMIEKRTGRVSYAVLSFGGFLGIGDDHYPVPWPALKYNTALGGYQIAVTVNQLEGAPRHSAEGDRDWAKAAEIDDYYGAPATA